MVAIKKRKTLKKIEYLGFFSKFLNFLTCLHILA
jgi:hypothetical protein